MFNSYFNCHRMYAIFFFLFFFSFFFFLLLFFFFLFSFIQCSLSIIVRVYDIYVYTTYYECVSIWACMCFCVSEVKITVHGYISSVYLFLRLHILKKCILKDVFKDFLKYCFGVSVLTCVILIIVG